MKWECELTNKEKEAGGELQYLFKSQCDTTDELMKYHFMTGGLKKR